MNRPQKASEPHAWALGITSVAYPDPGSGDFLTPGSGIDFFWIPDSDPRPHIFEALETIFGLKVL